MLPSIDNSEEWDKILDNCSEIGPNARGLSVRVWTRNKYSFVPETYMMGYLNDKPENIIRQIAWGAKIE